LLLSPDQFGQDVRIGGAVLSQAIRFVAGIYDFVLIDCQTGLDELTLATASCCDELFLVATPEVTALRDLARYLDKLQEFQVAPEKLKVVINQWSPNRSITIPQIEKAIQHPVALTLPSDHASLTRALETGQPISPGQKSEFGNQIRKWAADLAPATLEPAPTKRRFMFWTQREALAE
jgi:Flp pilus assembly CpaE family ATPase